MNMLKVAFSVATIAIWMTVVLMLSGTEAIIISDPGKAATLDEQHILEWEGKGIRDKICMASDTYATHTIQGDSFRIRTGPYSKQKDTFASLRIECDGLPMAYAARQLEYRIKQKKTEIARIGLNLNELNTWVDENLAPIIKDSLESIKGETQEFDAGVYKDIKIEITDVDVTDPRLRVDEGLLFYSEVTVSATIHDPDCFWCSIDDVRLELRGRVNARGVFTISENIDDIDVNTEIRASDISYKTSIILLPDDLKIINKWIEGKLNSAAQEKEQDVNQIVEFELNQQLVSLMDRLGPEFADWLTKNQAIPRVTTWMEDGNFGFTRGKSELGGERIEFSVSVDSHWLGRDAPTLNFGPQVSRTAVRLKFSYALINKVIEVLFDRSAYELIESAKEVQEFISVFSDSLAEENRIVRTQSEQYLLDAYRDVNEILEMAGFEFDTDYDFTLPINIAPVNRNDIRISLSGARVFRETRNASRTRLAVYVELMIGLTGRQATKSKQKLVQRSFAIVAVPDGHEEMVQKHHREFATIMTAFVRGEPTRWNIQQQGQGQMANMIRSAVDKFDSVLQLELPFKIRIGTLDIELTRLENDFDEYAVSVFGQAN